ARGSELNGDSPFCLMTWPHRGKVQLASDNTHLADLRTLPMPRAHHAPLVECLSTIGALAQTRLLRGLSEQHSGGLVRHAIASRSLTSPALQSTPAWRSPQT